MQHQAQGTSLVAVKQAARACPALLGSCTRQPRLWSAFGGAVSAPNLIAGGLRSPEEFTSYEAEQNRINLQYLVQQKL